MLLRLLVVGSVRWGALFFGFVIAGHGGAFIGLSSRRRGGGKKTAGHGAAGPDSSQLHAALCSNDAPAVGSAQHRPRCALLRPFLGSHERLSDVQSTAKIRLDINSTFPCNKSRIGSSHVFLARQAESRRDTSLNESIYDDRSLLSATSI